MQRDFVVLQHEIWRDQVSQIARAGVYVIYPAADTAMEVVVVSVLWQFVAGVFARQQHSDQFTFFHHLLQVAVDRGQAQLRHPLSRQFEDFIRQDRPASRFHGIAYGVALPGVASGGGGCRDHGWSVTASFLQTIMHYH